MSDDTAYIDDYSTCERTWVTLCVYAENDPAEVSERLGIALDAPGVESLPKKQLRKEGPPLSRWFLSSKGLVTSKDSRRHIDWLLDQVLPRRQAIAALQSEGAEVCVSCFWASAQGHGGPILSKRQLARLAELGLDFDYDIYDESE